VNPTMIITGLTPWQVRELACSVYSAPPPRAGRYSSKITRLGHSTWPAPGTDAGPCTVTGHPN